MRVRFTPNAVKTDILSRLWLFLMALTGSLLVLPAIASASTLISQSFKADAAIPAGSIVSVRKDQPGTVETTTIDNAINILGVAIEDGGSQLSISTTGGTQVQVATSGIETVLVSDINGKIVAGDPVAASPISGVGMKATTSTKVVGIAQDNFPNSTASKQSYTDKNKQKHDVTLGQASVLVNVAYYYKQPEKTLIPQALQNIANALAGKPVNALPIIISIGIFIVTLIVVVSIIYALIHSSIISVGRNPMAQAAVYRNVIQLSALVIGILAVSVTAIFLILKKF